MPTNILTNVVKRLSPIPLLPANINNGELLAIGSVPIGQGLVGSGFLRKLYFEYVNFENIAAFNDPGSFAMLTFDTSPSLILSTNNPAVFNIDGFITLRSPPFPPNEFYQLTYTGDNQIITPDTVITYWLYSNEVGPMVVGGLSIFYKYELTYIKI